VRDRPATFGFSKDIAQHTEKFMTANKALVAVLATAFAVAVACGGSDGPTDNNGNTGATGSTGSTGSTSNAIDVDDNSYTPSNTTVAAGTTVTWTWVGGNQHSVTFSSGSSSGAAQSTGTFQRTFPTAGTFNYQCSVHGSAMSGKITVQ